MGERRHIRWTTWCACQTCQLFSFQPIFPTALCLSKNANISFVQERLPNSPGLVPWPQGVTEYLGQSDCLPRILVLREVELLLKEEKAITLQECLAWPCWTTRQRRHDSGVPGWRSMLSENPGMPLISELQMIHLALQHHFKECLRLMFLGRKKAWLKHRKPQATNWGWEPHGSEDQTTVCRLWKGQSRLIATHGHGALGSLLACSDLLPHGY